MKLNSLWCGRCRASCQIFVRHGKLRCRKRRHWVRPPEGVVVIRGNTSPEKIAEFKRQWQLQTNSGTILPIVNSEVEFKQK